MTTDTDTALAEQRIKESAAVVEALLAPLCIAAVTATADRISACLRDGGKVILFGNGGSAADATHIAAEFVGRFLIERRALPALSLSDNASAVTAIGNDYGYEQIFARQVQALAAPADVALAISTSGRSPNVLAGVEAARSLGIATIGLTGADGGPLRAAVDVCIEVPSDVTPRIQEAHTVVAHILCELIEREIAA